MSPSEQKARQQIDVLLTTWCRMPVPRRPTAAIDSQESLFWPTHSTGLLRGGNRMSDVVIYQAEDGRTRVNVQLAHETVWLNQRQMAKYADSESTR